MPSPFPGMDPYLEGYLWPDVHHSLASQLRDQLNPHLRPRYVARIEVQVALDEAPEGEIGIMYPDVEIVRSRRRLAEPPLFSPGEGVLVAEMSVTTPVSLSVPLLQVEVPLATVEIRDTAQNQLVTCIEILSPINKREPGLTKYREKRQRLHAAGVHLLEIDLLRRGQRPLTHPRVPATGYLVSLTRAGSQVVDLWTMRLQDPLPVVAVPLRVPDDDIALDLPAALGIIYERAAYDLSINYAEPPPPPPLSAAEAQWVHQLLKDASA